ncbi:hypothetical protein AAG747_07070 [Rapidithrix thailandica]|uniref:Uncharacterized protein n=1 Tax=Rapidithrix thailandica TaxID=413964 RepID=A0AAW9S9S6_9BACT
MSELVASTSLKNEKHFHLFIDDANQVIVARWKGFLKPEQLDEGTKALTQAIRSRRIKKHLSDQSELKVLSSDIQKRLVEGVLPEIERAGVTKLAVKSADDIFAIATVEKVNNSSQIGNMTIKTFNTDQQCLNWLNEK